MMQSRSAKRHFQRVFTGIVRGVAPQNTVCFAEAQPVTGGQGRDDTATEAVDAGADHGQRGNMRWICQQYGRVGI